MSKLISFEGVDGAGKSSHIEWLAGQLEKRGMQVVCTREPGGTPLGEKLRGLLLAEPMSIDTELMLMFAARKQHIADVIEPALAQGKVVITDRFVDSTYAFQGGGRQVPFERIAVLDAWCGGPRPELTLLFDVPVEVAMSRIAGTRSLDRFEQEQREFHQRVREAYHHRAASDTARVRVINSDRPIEWIRWDIAEAVMARLLQGEESKPMPVLF